MKHHDISFRLLIALLVPVFTCVYGTAFSQEHGWEQMTSLNTAREAAASFVTNDKIYVFGGVTSMTSVTASVEIYDTESDDWSVASNLDQAKYTVCSGMINNKVYLMGGWARINGSWQTINSNLEYDHETDSYAEKQSTPLNIGFGASCVYNNLVYAFGGFLNDGSNITKSWVYDPDTDSWDTICAMQFQHGDMIAAQVIGDEIYVMGGVEGDAGNWTMPGKVELYNPDSNSWETKAEMPIPVSGYSSVVHDEKILVFGGDTGVIGEYHSTGSNLIQEYDPASNTWELKQGMPFLRTDMVAQKVGNYVYLIGGRKNSRVYTEPVLSEVWRFNLDSLRAYDPAHDSFLAIKENTGNSSISLHQNYPNPFREYTQIRYDLQHEGVVNLRVFNFLGQEVTTLVDTYQNPGNYEVTWNAKDVKPGIYFIQLKAGDFEVTRKAAVY